MLFNSVDFLIFFPIVVFIYFVLPKKARYIWLLAASYYFYMSWNAKYAILIALSTLNIAIKNNIDYYDFNYCKKEFFDRGDVKLFKDIDHLNKNGAEKFTQLFGDLVSGKYANSVFET